ncbi:DUF6339 family protein [Bacillus atrophaeus]|uniref:DUF6339 family protein n=1 Tax=Bacillus atrophaeus TaxID=1452 RepID=UPI00227F15C6|nr:DUF6339 family protein [Bacillus atrophaeus]MCY8466770.1 DUF6339 family protein [Bacillus atrophaeus]MCY8479718.1 DUF6339 family protein [Bacillus atrophaeus]MCY8914490.1 DUF6339 family protein [Bacillus atrophaeus]MCY9116468.1 DUF6339 family protein [Bacillus atrophaeus]MEC0927523.1 DUF6339 family protein [Bacillus atrophaeus]
MIKLKDEILGNLKADIVKNISYYKQDEVWLQEYLNHEFPSGVAKIELLIQDENNEKLDYDNAVLLFNALAELTPAEASKENLWVFLTHVSCWEYMRKRWPVNGQNDLEKAINFVKNRYFFGQKPYSRNGIARLWWFGYITHDPDLEDPYELTKIMLQNQDQDVSRMIAESPNILRNKNAVRIVLRTLQRMQENSEKTFSKRTFIRYAAIYLNYRGGVTVLTALNDEEMKLVVEELIKNWPSYLEKEQRAKKEKTGQKKKLINS